MAKRKFTDEQLDWIRSKPLDWAVDKIGGFISVDSAYSPIKNHRSQIWFVTVNNEIREILVTGIKWIDKRTGKAGGGCIDLTMHLLSCDFVSAVKRLLEVDK